MELLFLFLYTYIIHYVTSSSDRSISIFDDPATYVILTLLATITIAVSWLPLYFGELMIPQRYVGFSVLLWSWYVALDILTLPAVPLLLNREGAQAEIPQLALNVAQKIWAEALFTSTISVTFYMACPTDYSMFGSYASLVGLGVVYLCYLMMVLSAICTTTLYRYFSYKY